MELYGESAKRARIVVEERHTNALSQVLREVTPIQSLEDIEYHQVRVP
jgi:hypothetical protein